MIGRDGSIAEEYNAMAKRQVGSCSYPRAFSRVELINTALNLTRAGGPAQHRAGSRRPSEATPKTGKQQACPAR